jgi:hypothetical protein
MKDQLVTFKVAKLVKEKGFNIDCQKVYNTLGEIWKAYYTTMNNTDIDLGALCTAPTQSLLQRWLRENNNIKLEINYSDCEWWIWRIIKDDINFSGTNEFDDINLSYEEVLEEGLKQALKLI